MKITLIAAMDQNQLIGSNNQLPWHLPEDLKFFKQQTTGKTLLMGRKTCESLPFSLPNRRNIVLSRNAKFSRNGFETIQSIDQIQSIETDDLVVIGGAKIYQLLLPIATHMTITKLHHEFDGDTYFPTFEWNEWQIIRLTNVPKSASNPDFAYDFIFYQRIST